MIEKKDQRERTEGQVKGAKDLEEHGLRTSSSDRGAMGDPHLARARQLANEAHRRARRFTGGKQIPTRRPATAEDIERLTGTPEHPDVHTG